MEFTFHSLEELQQFIAFAGFKRAETATMELRLDTKALTAAVNEVARELQNPQEIEAPESDRDLSGRPVAEAAVEVKPARKRRTKAEMEAARAAESGETVAADVAAGQPDRSAMTSAGAATSQSTPGAGNPFAQQELPKTEPTEEKSAKHGDLTEFLASRLAERPEVSQIEHLNLARAFIGKHGMPKYNESFSLVGLSSNVMTFGPTECAKHAAVLDFLASE